MSNETRATDRRESIASIEKASAMLDIFASSEEEAFSIAELSRRLGWTKQTTGRFVRTLEALDWLERRGPKRRPEFRLGLGLLALAGAVQATRSLRAEAHDAIHELSRATGHTTYLLLRRGSSAVCVDRVRAENIAVMHFGVGDSHPLTRGGAGPAILAAQPPLEQTRVLDELGVSDEDRATWHRRAAEIEARGYNLSHRDVVAGISSMGVALRGPSGHAPAGISLATVSERLSGPNTEHIAELLLNTAQGLSDRLGALGFLDESSDI